MAKPRILILEDVETDADLVQRELSQGGVDADCLRVEDEAGFVAALEGFAPDLVLSDFNLPGWSGLAALRTTQRLAPAVPFIIVTGSLTEETAVECIKAGAADYVLKERPHRLAPAVTAALERSALLRDKARVDAEVRKLIAAVEQSPSVVVVTDIEGRIEYVNPRFREVTGFTLDEVRGQTPRVLKSGSMEPLVYQELWRSLLSGRSWTGEFLNRRKDGTLYWESASISPIRAEGGAITHFVAVKEDITARKEAERVLQETQRQLLRAQKMEAVGRLAGGVAHDFNNLLNVIYGYGELVREALPKNSPAAANLSEVLRAAQRAAGLTRQLLAFSRQQVLEPRVVDPGELLAGVEKMLRRLIGEDIDLQVLRPATISRIKADPGQFEQVLMNLVVNARDAMPEGGRLRIELREVDPAALPADESPAGVGDAVPAALRNRLVEVAVADDGIGMDAETQARIFEPFFTTKGPDRGTGLGLATVYGIVRQHGGTISVESAPGRGSTFRVRLPAVDGPCDELVAVSPAGAARRGNETILVLEDDPTVLGLVNQILVASGYHVLATGRGDDALRLGSEHAGKIDLLLADIVVPGMSGRDVAATLTQVRPALAVLFMSGYTAEPTSRHGVEADSARLLQKPFTPRALLDAVRAALDG